MTAKDPPCATGPLVESVHSATFPARSSRPRGFLPVRMGANAVRTRAVPRARTRSETPRRADGTPRRYPPRIATRRRPCRRCDPLVFCREALAARPAVRLSVGKRETAECLSPVRPDARRGLVHVEVERANVDRARSDPPLRLPVRRGRRRGAYPARGPFAGVAPSDRAQTPASRAGVTAARAYGDDTLRRRTTSVSLSIPESAVHTSATTTRRLRRSRPAAPPLRHRATLKRNTPTPPTSTRDVTRP